MLRETIAQAMNRQINAELYSAYLYLSMSDWCEHEGFPGFANWLRVQAREELAHGTHILDHTLERGARPRLEAVPAPPETFRDLLDIFEQTLRHEEQVTTYIGAIATLAMKEEDHATYNFIQWYVNEQVEEESTAGLLVQKLRFIGENAAMLYALDTELAARPPHGGWVLWAADRKLRRTCSGSACSADSAADCWGTACSAGSAADCFAADSADCFAADSADCFAADSAAGCSAAGFVCST